MKKSKLSIGLVTSFIAAMALSACGSKTVTSDKDNIVTFKGYGDEDLSVVTDQIYDDYLKSSSGISKYYDQVMEVLIRNAFKRDQKGDGSLKNAKKNYNQIVNEAKDNVKSAKSTAKQNAETNGTSYKTEWQAILSSKGVKDEQELLQSYIYDLEKEVIEDWYYEKHREELRKEFIGLEQTAKAPSKFPYHVRHILVKVEDGANDYVRGTISAEQAKLLSSTVDLLAQGTLTFGEVAKMKSEDGSASQYGDLDIMSNSASGGNLGMVNEFQLGIYAYDAIIKNGASTNKAVKLGLGTELIKNADETEILYGRARKGSDQSVAEAFTAAPVNPEDSDLRINEIPYSVFKELGDVAELEANYDSGLSIEDGKAAIYPRNLLWNRYLNNHGIFVVTNGARESNKDVFDATSTDEVLDVKKASSYYGNGIDDYVKYDKTTKDIDYSKLAGMKVNELFKNGGTAEAEQERVLSDDKDNVIIGVRSQYGIHFMIVQKSAFDDNLERYYTTTIPTDSDYEGKDDQGNEYDTYVNFITSSQTSDYTARADKVKSAIKGYDSTYDYRLYEELSTVEYGVERTEGSSNEKLFNLIDDYIQIQREKNEVGQKEGMEKVWQTYVELLDNQYFYRHELNRVVPEGCKIAFTNPSALTAEQKKAYEEGGACYVK